MRAAAPGGGRRRGGSAPGTRGWERLPWAPPGRAPQALLPGTGREAPREEVTASGDGVGCSKRCPHPASEERGRRWEYDSARGRPELQARLELGLQLPCGAKASAGACVFTLPCGRSPAGRAERAELPGAAER